MLKNQRTNSEKVIGFSGSFVLILLLILFLPGNSFAAVTGVCSNCHTMHNSQGGAAMATYGGETGPNSFLTRGSCVGCHAQGTASKIVTAGTSQIPQVYHSDGSGDLAAGNFSYIGVKGGATPEDAKGHNVIDLFGANSDGVLDAAPGVYMVHSGFLSDTYLTCAGENGCHGTRMYNGTDLIGIASMKGAHHGNVDGQLATADTVANSYRFLLGVKGLENPTAVAGEKWQNVSGTSHNEYYGRTTPTTYDCGSYQCHPSTVVKPLNGTITEFCGTCHPDFHGTGNIGGDNISPFTRHPTDIVIRDSDEYAVASRTYDADAPVGRTTVPASVITGATTTDVITCLSCHAAHATNYPDMLKWNYPGDMVAGGGGSGGCFTCHTEKN